MDDKCSDISPKIVNPLLEWYDQNQRILPWRGSRNPYKIWISEIMLQQTRVEAVKPYFDRFISEVPSVEHLADLPEDNLLKLWEGLGYYNRARNLQKAAQIMKQNNASKLPSKYDELLKLPGIGTYTAGAVASIAFNERVPAVDGNVLRILTRLTNDSSDVLSAAYKKQVEKKLSEIMPVDRPGDFNQAMMELGAMVCIPVHKPKCDICPWEELCEISGTELYKNIPYKAPKKKRQKEEKTVLLVMNGQQILIHKRENKGLLAGMYEFPMIDGYWNENQIKAYVRKLGYEPMYIKEAGKYTHVFSHKEWEMNGYFVKIADPGEENLLMEHKPAMSGGVTPEREGEDFQLILTAEIEKKYPIPSAFRYYAEKVNIYRQW